jgi:hypothetical protein
MHYFIIIFVKNNDLFSQHVIPLFQVSPNSSRLRAECEIKVLPSEISASPVPGSSQSVTRRECAYVYYKNKDLEGTGLV